MARTRNISSAAYDALKGGGGGSTFWDWLIWLGTDAGAGCEAAVEEHRRTCYRDSCGNGYSSSQNMWCCDEVIGFQA